MQFRDVIRKTQNILLYHGYHNQRLKAVEEFGELLAEIAKVETKKYGAVNNKALIEECADAMVMLLQMWHMAGFRECKHEMYSKLFQMDTKINSDVQFE